MLRSRSGLRVALALLVLAALAPAQCAAPEWRNLGQRPNLDLAPNAAVTWDPDGAGPVAPRLVVAGGSYSDIRTLASWDGSSWEVREVIPPWTGESIVALAVWNGDLIAAGHFTSIGGVAASRIARWNGSSWAPLGTGIDGWVYALIVYNGDLIAAGQFTTAGGGAASNIARFDGSAWHPLGGGIYGGVYSLAVLGGELIAAGNFTAAGGVAVGSIAKWNGTVWQELGPVAYTWGVSRVAVHNGELYASGGHFFNAGVLVAQNIARWDGVSFQPMGAPVGPAVRPYVTFNGDLIASGTDGVLGWDGASWYPLGPAPPPGPAAYSSGTVTTFAGELIASVIVAPGYGIARWDGAAWQPLGAAFDWVKTLTTFHDEVVAGGIFTTANGSPGNRITRWNGATWQPIGTGFDGGVAALWVHGGDLIAAGGFSSAGGIATGPIARWTGSAWIPLAPPSAGLAPWGISSLVSWNGDLVVGGGFTTAGGVTVNGIARWDGASWHPLGSGMSFGPNPGSVRALTVFNGDLVAGGSFDVAGGVTVNGIARWDGVSWHALGAGTWLSWGPSTGEVMALTVANGELFIGGNFTDAGGAPASNVARWDGTSWSALGAGVTGGEPISVASLAAIGGDVIAGGRFNTAGGVNANSIARWNGSSWALMGDGLTGYLNYTTVETLTEFRGSVIAGGLLSGSSNLNSPYIARWSSPLPMLAVSQPGGAGSGVQVRNAWLLLGHEYYNLASLDLAPGGPGSGPYGGLSYVDVSVLVSQLSMPVGTPPFHILASGPAATHGPYTVPPGITFEAISVDVTGGSLGCISTALQYTTY